MKKWVPKPRECTTTRGNLRAGWKQKLASKILPLPWGRQYPSSHCVLNTNMVSNHWEPLCLLYLCNTYITFFFFAAAAQKKEKWKIKNFCTYICYIHVAFQSYTIFFLLFCSCSFVLKDNMVISSAVTPRNKKLKWSREELREYEIGEKTDLEKRES